MDQKKIFDLQEKLRREASSARAARRRAEKEVADLLKVAEGLSSANREALDNSISDWQKTLEKCIAAQQRLEASHDVVGEFLDHLGKIGAWQGKIEKLVTRHENERNAAESEIQKLESRLNDARQRWFVGQCQRPEVNRIRAAIAEQRAVVEDLGDLTSLDAGIPALFKTRRQQLEDYKALLNKAGKALDTWNPANGVSDQIRRLLDSALDVIGEAGESFGRSVTIRSMG